MEETWGTGAWVGRWAPRTETPWPDTGGREASVRAAVLSPCEIVIIWHKSWYLWCMAFISYFQLANDGKKSRWQLQAGSFQGQAFFEHYSLHHCDCLCQEMDPGERHTGWDLENVKQRGMSTVPLSSVSFSAVSVILSQLVIGKYYVKRFGNKQFINFN
jgi:hypothetical protein